MTYDIFTPKHPTNQQTNKHPPTNHNTHQPQLYSFMLIVDILLNKPLPENPKPIPAPQINDKDSNKSIQTKGTPISIGRSNPRAFDFAIIYWFWFNVFLQSEHSKIQVFYYSITCRLSYYNYMATSIWHSFHVRRIQCEFFSRFSIAADKDGRWS